MTAVRKREGGKDQQLPGLSLFKVSYSSLATGRKMALSDSILSPYRTHLWSSAWHTQLCVYYMPVEIYTEGQHLLIICVCLRFYLYNNVTCQLCTISLYSVFLVYCVTMLQDRPCCLQIVFMLECFCIPKPGINTIYIYAQMTAYLCQEWLPCHYVSHPWCLYTFISVCSCHLLLVCFCCLCTAGY